MRHEDKNPHSLVMTAEYISGGIPIGGLTPVLTVYNLKWQIWWVTHDPITMVPFGPGGGWTRIPPNTTRALYERAMYPAGNGVNYGAHWLDITSAHAKLAAGLTSADVDSTWSGPIPSDAGSEGYMVEISDNVHALRNHVQNIHLTYGLTDVNVAKWNNEPVFNSTSGYPNINVAKWDDNAVASASGSNLPNVNVADWGDTLHPAGNLDLSHDPNNHFPNINVQSWKGTTPADLNSSNLVNVNVEEWVSAPTTLSANSNPSINVSQWDDHAVTSSTAGVPDVNVVEWRAQTPKTLTSTNLVQVDTVEVSHNPDAADYLEDFMINGYDNTQHAVHDVKHVGDVAVLLNGSITSGSFTNASITAAAIDAGAIHDTALAAGAIHDTALAAGAIHTGVGGGDPVIADDAIHEDSIANHAIHAATIKDGAIHATALAAGAIHAAGGAGGAPAIEEGAIHAGNTTLGIGPALAENAISEGSIAIDSVTYEEISDSAVREIVNGVWSASVYGPIDGSGDFSGSEMGMAGAGTMGHAMLVDHLSNYMIHTYPHPHSPEEFNSTPMHTTGTYDPSGEKFYSLALAETPLLDPDETMAYVDRAGVLFRGMSLTSGDMTNTIKLWISMLDSGSPIDGWEGAELNIYDSNGDLVRSMTLDPGTYTGGWANVDIMLKPDSDYSWELLHGTDPGEIMVFGHIRAIQGVGPTLEIFAIGPSPAGGSTTGSFTTPKLNPITHQQHLIRIVEVGTDAGGQYFRIKRTDEDGSPIPGGIYATKQDPQEGLHDFAEGPTSPYTGDILIIKAETDATMHEVAHEVWEEDVDDHATPDTFGMLNRIIAGLSQYNHQITDSTYDESGRLLACRLVVYPNAEKARSGEDPLTTIEVTSTYDEKQNMVTFKAAEEN